MSHKQKINITNLKKIQETKIHATRCFPVGSFAVHIGDHLRFGIICGSIWGSFPVWGSFAVGDHLRRCTEPKTIYKYRIRKLNMGIISNMILDHIAKRRRLEARNLRNSYSYFNFHSLYNTLRTKRVVVSGPKSFRDVRETHPRRSLYSHWGFERG